MSILQSIDRVPPQNLEAEQGVLGSMLLDRDAIARVVEALRPEDFYRDVHRTIYSAILELFERGEPVDLITITNRLSGMGKLEDVGGASYLASLPNAVPTAANADFYAGIVLEKSMLRALISAGTHIASLGYEGMDEVTALIDQAEKLVYGIAARRNVQDFQAIKEILKASFEKIDKRYQEKGTVTGIATGFTDFDMLTSGLQPADMVIVAARPSVGKCLSHDAEILLEDGSIATIEEIVRRRRGRLLTLGADWKLRRTEPSAFVDDGIKPVFRVVTRLGRRVECTATHPFLTPHGWLPLASLRIGERVAVPRKVEVFGDKPLRECEIKLLAYLIADGPLTCDSRIMEDFAAAARAFGAERRQHPRPARPAMANPTTDLLALWLSGRERWGKNASCTEIPETVFALPRAQLALFLNRLFAVDGWTSAHREPGIARIGYATVSERLARQIQHLLLRFGVLAGVRGPDAAARVIRRDAWQLEIADPASIRTFVHAIGIFGKDPQMNGGSPAVEVIRRTSSTDPVLPEAWAAIVAVGRKGPWTALARRGRLQSIAQALKDLDRRHAAASDIYWDEIVSVEPGGEKRVYDLTISETHNFVANDICVHNTTFATNIAQHAAIAGKTPVAIFSLETSKDQLVQRILCSEARVDNTKLRTGFLADEDWRKLARAMGGLSEAPIFIDDSATLSIMEMRAKARKLKTEHGLGLMIIDYMQMIQSFKRAENRTQELSEIARGIKSLAKELDIPIIAISQLSRAVEALGSKRPLLSHLRECVTGDTVVWDADTGRRYSVAQLANSPRWPRLLSLDRTDKLIPVRPAAVIEKGENAVFEVRTSTGRRLRATANHPVLTPNGWNNVGELSPGALVAAVEDCRAIVENEFGAVSRRGQSNDTAEADFASVDPTTGTGERASGRPRGHPLNRPMTIALVERLDAEHITQMASSDLRWDRVVGVIPAGKAPVYDLVMPRTHNFVANELVVHNSGELEQVADLVVFLYREDYYDLEKAQRDNKEHICEIIIAKHRNGPIGTVELFFHKEFSRFENLEKRR